MYKMCPARQLIELVQRVGSIARLTQDGVIERNNRIGSQYDCTCMVTGGHAGFSNSQPNRHRIRRFTALARLVDLHGVN